MTKCTEDLAEGSLMGVGDLAEGVDQWCGAVEVLIR
jgi:hypothetical protein